MKTTYNINSDFVESILYTSTAFVLMAGVLIVFFYFSRKKILQNELEKKDLELSYQKEILHAVIITQEAERGRIAQDLHDDISSNLNIISLNSHLLITKNLTESDLNEISKNIIHTTTKAIENARRIAHDLLPTVLEKFGLESGVKELCYEINQSKQVTLILENKADFESIKKEYQLHIYRILQELIHNSIRHGKAKQISISFEGSSPSLICNYSDNGFGFDRLKTENKKGLGMKNIESRIGFINGTINYESAIAKGTTVIFKF